MANFLALPLTSFLHTHAQSFSSCARRKRPRPEEEDDMDRTPLERAVNAVKNGTMGLRLAAKTYGIQQNKLFRVLHGVQKMNSQMGRPTAIPKEVEDILAQKLRELIKNHFYLELVNLPFVAQDICEKLGIKATGWIALPQSPRPQKRSAMRRVPRRLMAPQKLKDQKNSFTSISACDDERREMPNSLGGPVVGELALPEQNRCFTFRPEGFCSGHHAKRCISANTTYFFMGQKKPRSSWPLTYDKRERSTIAFRVQKAGTKNKKKQVQSVST